MAGSNRWDLGHAVGMREGIAKGREEAMAEILQYLEDRYLDENVERGSAGGKAVLRIAHEVASIARGART